MRTPVRSDNRNRAADVTRSCSGRQPHVPSVRVRRSPQPSRRRGRPRAASGLGIGRPGPLQRHQLRARDPGGAHGQHRGSRRLRPRLHDVHLCARRHSRVLLRADVGSLQRARTRRVGARHPPLDRSRTRARLARRRAVCGYIAAVLGNPGRVPARTGRLHARPDRTGHLADRVLQPHARLGGVPERSDLGDRTAHLHPRHVARWPQVGGGVPARLGSCGQRRRCRRHPPVGRGAATVQHGPLVPASARHRAPLPDRVPRPQRRQRGLDVLCCPVRRVVGRGSAARRAGPARARSISSTWG